MKKDRESSRRLDRRQFVGSTAAISAAAVTKPVFGETRQEASVPDFIIDSHCHCGGTESWVQEMVSTYRPRGVMVCVLTYRAHLELMKKAIADYPDVFIGYGRVNVDDPNAVREIEDFHRNGFVGMKFHTPRKDFDDPSYYQLYRMCEMYRMHMLFHTGITNRSEFDKPTFQSASRMRPMFLDTIARLCPRTTLQGAHLGNPWYEEAAEAARWSPNLYFDVTGSTLLKFIKLGRLDRMKEILWWADDEAVENPHTLKGGPGAWRHIVFGTDERPAGLVPNIERFQKMLDVNQVPAADRAAMWGLTMAGVLGVDPRTRRLKPRQQVAT